MLYVSQSLFFLSKLTNDTGGGGGGGGVKLRAGQRGNSGGGGVGLISHCLVE